jgi:exopolysaccharide biosynthesis protein
MDSITGARIERDPSVMPDLARTQVAFAGMANGIVLWDGVARGTLEQSTDLNARTALGLSSDNRYLTLMTVNRSLRSITPTYWGASLYDVGVLLSGFGASKGLNLDGGGSALMASWDPVSGSAQLLNAPLFGAERNVGSNLGIAYSPPV